MLLLGDLARRKLAAVRGERDAEQIVQLQAAGGLVLPQADQFQMKLLGFLGFAGCQLHGFLKTRRRLGQIALHLPGGAQVGHDVEMTRMVALGGPQHLDCLPGLAEPDVQRPQVRGFFSAERLGLRRFFQPGRFFLIFHAQRTGGLTGLGFDRHAAQDALIREVAAPLRRQFRVGFPGEVQPGSYRQDQREKCHRSQKSPDAQHDRRSFRGAWAVFSITARRGSKGRISPRCRFRLY